MSLTEDCAKVTGIPFLMDAYRKEAMKILRSEQTVMAKRKNNRPHDNYVRARI